MASNEFTRRRLYDVDAHSCVKGNEIVIDFSKLKKHSCEFIMRTGSLTERKTEKERAALLEMIQPLLQNMNGWSDQSKQVVEKDVILPAIHRLLELSDTDIANTISDSLAEKLLLQVAGPLQDQINLQQEQIGAQSEQMDALAMMSGGGQPPMPPIPPQDPHNLGMAEKGLVQAPLATPDMPMPSEEPAGGELEALIKSIAAAGDAAPEAPGLTPPPNDGTMGAM